MRSWLAVCVAVVSALCCLVSAGKGAGEQFTRLANELTERNKGFFESGKTLFTMNEKAIVEAFNKVSEQESRRERMLSSSRWNTKGTLRVMDEAEDAPQGFFYGIAQALRMIPLMKEYLAPKLTREEKLARIQEDAAMDALRTRNIIKRNNEAREQARIRIMNAQNKQQQSGLTTREDDEEAICNKGRMERSVRLINACNTTRTCRVSKFNDTNVTLDTLAFDLVNNTDVEVTQMICDGLPVTFLDDYNASKCFIRAVDCDNETAIKNCPVEIICEVPSFLAFGMNDGRYAFGGTNDVIFCNGTAVEDPTVFANKTLPEECEVKRFPSSTNGTCYTINGTGLVTVFSSLCAISCVKLISEQQCTCPVDYTGIHCEEKENVTCQAYLVSPVPKCIVNAEDDLLVYDRPCFVYNGLEGKTIEMSWNISCKFESSSLRNNTRRDNFTYWLNTPDLRITEEPNWVVSLEAFQFSSFQEPLSLHGSTKMTRDNIVGAEVMNLKIRPDAQHIVGGRVYVELSFEGNNTPPGMGGVAMRRFFFDDKSGGYKGGYGKTVYEADGLGAGEISIIVVGSVVGVAIIAGIVRCIYERWKEEKISDEEAGERASREKPKKE